MLNHPLGLVLPFKGVTAVVQLKEFRYSYLALELGHPLTLTVAVLGWRCLSGTANAWQASSPVDEICKQNLQALHREADFVSPAQSWGVQLTEIQWVRNFTSQRRSPKLTINKLWFWRWCFSSISMKALSFFGLWNESLLNSIIEGS